MKLYYITRVSLPSNAAQSIQINAMCHAFHNMSKEIKNMQFRLISTCTEENKNINKDFCWEKIELKSKFKYLEFTIKSFFKVYKEKPTHVFTRDIVIAFVLSFFNIKVTYEAHKEPRTTTALLMIKYLKNKNNFYLVCISNALKSFYVKKYNFKLKRVLSVHDGVALENYNKIRGLSKKQLRVELNLPIEKIIVLHTGSLHKGNDAELFKVVLDNFENIQFIQVGGTEAYITKYKEFYKNNKNILFVKHQTHENVIKYQMCADLLFYALTESNKLWWCTSPLKIFEYMATGVPILGSNIGSVSEIISEENSIPYNPKDELSIKDGIITFLNNRKKTEKLAIKALQDIEKKYTWNIRTKGIIDFLDGKSR